MGGKDAGLTPHTLKHEGDTHWYLVKRSIVHTGYTDRWSDEPLSVMHDVIIDPTAKQFKTPPPYHLGRGRGFLTKKPSKRARALMNQMLWQFG